MVLSIFVDLLIKIQLKIFQFVHVCEELISALHVLKILSNIIIIIYLFEIVYYMH